jgi:hypothetical protein
MLAAVGELVARTTLVPSVAATGIENAIHAADADQAMSHAESMERVVCDSVASPGRNRCCSRSSPCSRW